MKTYRRILGSFPTASQSLSKKTTDFSTNRVPLHGFQPTSTSRPERKLRLFPSRPAKIAATGLTLAIIASSQAVVVSSLSVDFLGDFQAGALSPSDTAGVVPADQWAMAPGLSGIISPTDTLGSDTINVFWNAPTSALITGSTPTVGDNLMMEGYLTSKGDSTGVTPATVRVNSIGMIALGWDYYDVFVYSDTGTNGSTNNISLSNPGTTTYSHTESTPGFGVGGFATYADSQLVPPGNYVRFNGLSSSFFNLEVSNIIGASDLAAINGIQIIGHKNIPEPSTNLLALLSTSLLLLRRKRR